MFYKEKGFYISLLCGIVALVAFGAICFHMMGAEPEEDETPIATVETHKPTASPTPEPKTKETSADKVKSEVKTPAPTKKAVETTGKSIKNALHFNQEAGLLWLIEGDVLKEYSADKVVYFETLAEYRTNPALLISAQVDEDVHASANGIVTDIFTSEETGRTLTMDIGDGYTVSYGQLKGISVKKGDSVFEGQIIGKIADPTKYYSMEGANLYYQVKEKDETVNPMVLLR